MSGPTGNNPYRASGVVAAIAAGRAGTVDWDTSIHTSTVTAESGKGYFVNTTGGGITVNLPAATVGDIVGIKDYAGTFNSNACTIAPNGSDNIGGASAVDPTLAAEGESVLLVYADATQGWLTTQDSVTASPSGTECFVTATGGTPSAGEADGDYKYHTFTGPGTFCVSALGTTPANDVVSYIVVAGGAGGAGDGAGGGGAGGYREGKWPSDPYTASPLAAACSELPVSVQGYPVVVGGGGPVPGSSSVPLGGDGVDSSFSTITSTGGGGGGVAAANAGGSGGGGGRCSPNAGGAGDTPSTTPDQGFDGGDGIGVPGGGPSGGGGGGGATAVGVTATSTAGAAGGAGATSSINATPTARAGGGGGAAGPGVNVAGAGGAGGGGKGAGCLPTNPLGRAVDGVINTGGGGGGGTGGPSSPDYSNHWGHAGGSGIVIIRYKFQ